VQVSASHSPGLGVLDIWYDSTDRQSACYKTVLCRTAQTQKYATYIYAVSVSETFVHPVNKWYKTVHAVDHVAGV